MNTIEDMLYFLIQKNLMPPRLMARHGFIFYLYFSGHTGVVNSSSWSYSGQYLVTSSNDKTVKLWSKEQTTLMLTLDRLEGNMTPVAETKSRTPQVKL